MTDYDLHEPSYSGSTTDDWDAPQMKNFDTDDLSEIDDHFLLSASGLPSDEFTDLKIPVVDPDGDLNENALQTAHGGAHGVASVDDIDDETVEDATDLVEYLAQDAFDEDIGD